MAEETTDVPRLPLLLVDGYIASTTITDESEDSFQAQVEMVAGEWDGLSEVHAYRVQLILPGEEFRSRVPARPPRDPGRDQIMAGRRGIAVARLIDFIEDPVSGHRMPQLEVLYFRRAP